MAQSNLNFKKIARSNIEMTWKGKAWDQGIQLDGWYVQLENRYIYPAFLSLCLQTTLWLLS